MYSLWSATHNGEAITRGIAVRGRQTVSKTPLNTATSGDSWYYGAAGTGGGTGPIKAALKRLSCPAVTPGAMGALSASSASLFFRRTSAALSSSVLHAAINVRPPSITTSHHLPGSNATVFHPSTSPIPNSRRSSATQSVHSFSLPPRPRRPGFSRVPTMIRLGNLRLSIRMSAPAHNNLLVRTVVSILSQPVC